MIIRIIWKNFLPGRIRPKFFTVILGTLQKKSPMSPLANFFSTHPCSKKIRIFPEYLSGFFLHFIHPYQRICNPGDPKPRNISDGENPSPM